MDLPPLLFDLSTLHVLQTDFTRREGKKKKTLLAETCKQAIFI